MGGLHQGQTFCTDFSSTMARQVDADAAVRQRQSSSDVFPVSSAPHEAVQKQNCGPFCVRMPARTAILSPSAVCSAAALLLCEDQVEAVRAMPGLDNLLQHSAGGC